VVTYTYTIYGDGDILLDTHIMPDPNLPPLRGSACHWPYLVRSTP